MPSRRMPLRRNFPLFSRHARPHRSKPNHVYARNLSLSLLQRAPHIRSHQRSRRRICASMHSKIMGQSRERQTSRKIPSGAPGTSSSPVDVFLCRYLVPDFTRGPSADRGWISTDSERRGIGGMWSSWRLRSFWRRGRVKSPRLLCF